MRIALALMAAGAFFISGCKTTQMASETDHEIFVTIDGDHGDAERKVSIVVKRDGEETVHIAGDAASPEVQEQLALLKIEGVSVMGDDDHFRHAGSVGKKRKWVMKHGDENERGGTVEAEGEYVIIVKDDEPVKREGAHKRIIVIEGGNEEEVRKQLKEHGIELKFDFELDEGDEAAKVEK